MSNVSTDNVVASIVRKAWDLIAVHPYLCVISVVALYLLQVRYCTPLRRIPGPFGASFTRLWKVSRILYHRQELVMIDMHRRYGFVVRIGPNEVSIADPDALKVIYGPGSHFSKSRWYPTWNMAGKSHKSDIFSEPDGNRHAASKRLVANSYSMNTMTELESHVQTPIDRLLLRMGELADANKPVSFTNWMQWFAFDVMGQISFSRDFGFLHEGRDINNTLASIESMLWSGIVLSEIPELYDISQASWFRALPFVGNYGKNLNLLIDKAQHYIGERRISAGVDRRDLLSRFFVIQDSHSEKFDDLDVQILATLNIFAGSDTTSIALRAILYFLISNPRTIQALRMELDRAANNDQLDEPPKFTQLQKLLYLQACIKEAMRLHPSLGTQHTRLVPTGGVTIDGRYLPEKTVVGINSWVMHRDKSVFGHDAGTFRPERWLEGDKGAMERHFMSFGYGAHMCLGKNIALLEITKVVPQIVQAFDMEFATVETGGLPISCISHTFVAQKNFYVLCKRRQR